MDGRPVAQGEKIVLNNDALRHKIGIVTKLVVSQPGERILGAVFLENDKPTLKVGACGSLIEVLFAVRRMLPPEDYNFLWE